MPERDPGSYRDPRGHVYVADDRVFRCITPIGESEFRAVRQSGAVNELIERGWLIAETEVDPASGNLPSGASCAALIEHPRLPFVSYPYEWCFSALQDAAVLHLDIQRHCLRRGVMLTDASAYNLQFNGTRPLFIDSLSFRPYRDGEPWAGHQQFCDEFLNPLLLASKCGVAFQAWYRGQLNGIPTAELAPLLPLRSRFSLVQLQHVFALAALNRRASRRRDRASRSAREVRVSRDALLHILHTLRRFIAGLVPHGRLVQETLWSDYTETRSYDEPEQGAKREFIERMLGEWRPKRVIDLGSNTGEYSAVALAAGAELAIGVEGDHGAADAAYRAAREAGAMALPLVADLANEPPAQGWQGVERRSLSTRLAGDCVFALALVHHLAIARNLPLRSVLAWIVERAPRGIVEFVPKSDPRVQDLLRLREDLFADYTEASFRNQLSEVARVVSVERVSASGRQLYAFERDRIDDVNPE